jgi:pimeloyl-ACP methyl ester carboxylesterase
VAARVRPLADPGGICISEPVQRIVRSHPHIRTRSLGARSLKNVESPLELFAVETDPSAIATLSRPGRLLNAAAGAALALAAVAGAVYPNRTAVLSSVALHAPFLFFPNPVEQEIGFATTSDGVRIAYATTGSGPPLVFVLGWMTHLERGLGSNLYDREGVIAERSKGHLLVRYDGRGFGMSQRNVEDFSLDARVRDIEAVVDALGLERFAVYAVSAGGPAAVAYTARHPERVSGLVLTATFVGGPASSERRRQSEALADLYRVAWDQPAVRALFAARLGSNASDVEQRVLAEFLRVSADGPSVAGFIEANRGIDARDLARQIRVPALVVAGDLDVSVPLEASSELAALIPGSRFEVLRGADHIQTTATSPRLRALIDEFLTEVQAK